MLCYHATQPDLAMAELYNLKEVFAGAIRLQDMIGCIESSCPSGLTLRRLPRALCGRCRLFHPIREARIFNVAFRSTGGHAGVPDELEAMTWLFSPI